ncbi:MAG: hypothetical protein Q9227_002625 [Pyrenula ochraceoflavens]
MAPAPRSSESKPMYAANEKVLCFHHDLLYDAKVLEVQSVEKEGTTVWQYRVHYKGWKNTWDDLVPQDRLRKLNDENRELQAQLKMDYSNVNEPRRQNNKAPPSTRKARAGQGSELGSGRGSEDPHANIVSRKRNRDNEIEKTIPYEQSQRLSDSTANQVSKVFRFTIAAVTTFKLFLLIEHRIMVRHSQAQAQSKSTTMRPSRQAITRATFAKDMTFEEIDASLNFAPPPDPNEHMSLANFKSQQPCAPLISGTIQEHDIPHHHKFWSARREPNDSAAKALFYTYCSVGQDARIAGVPSDLSYEGLFDGPGAEGPFDINKWKDRIGDLRLETILRVVDKATSKPHLKKFMNYLVEEVPISDPPKWLIEPPIAERRPGYRPPGNDEHFNASKMANPTRYLDTPPLDGAALRLHNTWRELQDSENISGGLIEYLDNLFREWMPSNGSGTYLSIANAVLIMQVCQVLTKIPWKEEQYRMRPMVRMPIPEVLKNVLVDDWENVTKTLMLVKLPSERPVNWILDEYLNQKWKLIDPASADSSILEEFVEGMKLYFKQALGRLLLYRFERDQYADLGKKYWNKATPQKVRSIDSVTKKETWQERQIFVGDIYGAEHLCRLLGEQILLA